MRNLEEILTILFRRVSAKSVLEGSIKAREFEQDDFVRIAFAYMNGYSQPELLNMWLYYKDTFKSERRNYQDSISEDRDIESRDGFCVFDAIFYLSKRKLMIQENQIACLYTEIQSWRKLTLQLSEDLLVCAYCAANKSIDEMCELGFSWKTVIGHNNQQLNKILKRGISENHFHLNGSAPIFHVSWLSLMNVIERPEASEMFVQRQKRLKDYDRNRKNVNVRYGNDYEEDSLQMQCYQATFIRAFLYAKIMNIEFPFSKNEISFLLKNPNDMAPGVPA